ncbi:MAG: branched-chain amino acid transporter AzlC [Tissierellia bacterium]|nr:branched-chain amino acid transporter AzlC [Tissierellia bacterium]
MKDNKTKKAFVAAFPQTIPILTAFFFIGISYGILMKVSGFSFWYPFLISIFVYGGSLQFVAIDMLLMPFNPIGAILMTIMLHVRQMFYSIAMLENYRGAGARLPLMVYYLADETFSVNFSAKIPADVDKHWFYFFVTLLNLFYWAFSSLLGGLLGSLISFNTKGLDFVMTALFVAIFVDLMREEKNRMPGIIGVIVAAVCLWLFGPVKFMVPTLLLIVVLLIGLRKKIEVA